MIARQHFTQSLNVFLSLLSFVAACTKDELVMVQFVSRHGRTAPAELYPTDPNPSSVWAEGLGSLTMLGKFQSYALGSLLRGRYDYFITSNPLEVDILSSSRRPSVKSALSMATALYAPSSEWEVVRGLAWQPLFVEYDPQHLDKYLQMTVCPGVEEEYEKLFTTPEAEEFLLKYVYLFDYWSLHSGWKIKDWDSAALLFDVLETEQAYNLTVPMWARRYWEELQYISDMALQWKLSTKRLQSLQGGPLLELVLDKMKRKATGAVDVKKVVIYSTNSQKVAAFLSTLNFFNGREPSFSATVAVELYKEVNEHYVRFLYFNSTNPEREPQLIHVLVMEGCSEFCPLDYVLDYTKDAIPDDWEAECNLV